MALRFVEGDWDHGKYKLQAFDESKAEWMDVPCMKKKEEEPRKLATIFSDIRMKFSGMSYTYYALETKQAEAAVKVVERVIDDYYAGQPPFLISGLKAKLRELL